MLVTGADGFIGSHLVEALLRRGRFGAGLLPLHLDLVPRLAGRVRGLPQRAEADGRAEELLRRHPGSPGWSTRAVDGVDIVLHLAALIAIPYSYIAPQSYVDTNVTGTLNVLEAVRRHGTAADGADLDLGGLRNPRDGADHASPTRCAGSRRTARPRSPPTSSARRTPCRSGHRW